MSPVIITNFIEWYHSPHHYRHRERCIVSIKPYTAALTAPFDSRLRNKLGWKASWRFWQTSLEYRWSEEWKRSSGGNWSKCRDPWRRRNTRREPREKGLGEVWWREKERERGSPFFRQRRDFIAHTLMVTILLIRLVKNDKEVVTEVTKVERAAWRSVFDTQYDIGWRKEGRCGLKLSLLNSSSLLYKQGRRYRHIWHVAVTCLIGLFHIFLAE